MTGPPISIAFVYAIVSAADRPEAMSAAECRSDRAGVLRRDPQERSSRAYRPAPALLPVPKRSDAHPDHERKIRLRLPELLADGPDVLFPDLGHARRLHVPAEDPATLADARAELAKHLLVHGYSRSI